jgi:four helix bundle protein
MQSFHDLKVWRKAHALTIAIYRTTTAFPSEERYGITAQIRRAAASVAANIAEGCGRGSDADFARFLHNAMGSASEVEYFVLLARDLEFLEPERAESLTADTTEIKRMLASLIARLKPDS